jgi:hypothetical protein
VAIRCRGQECGKWQDRVYAVIGRSKELKTLIGDPDYKAKLEGIQKKPNEGSSILRPWWRYWQENWDEKGRWRTARALLALDLARGKKLADGEKLECDPLKG